MSIDISEKALKMIASALVVSSKCERNDDYGTKFQTIRVFNRKCY